jgi:hypothetical protein
MYLKHYSQIFQWRGTERTTAEQQQQQQAETDNILNPTIPLTEY